MCIVPECAFYLNVHHEIVHKCTFSYVLYVHFMYMVFVRCFLCIYGYFPEMCIMRISFTIGVRWPERLESLHCNGARREPSDIGSNSVLHGVTKLSGAKPERASDTGTMDSGEALRPEEGVQRREGQSAGVRECGSAGGRESGRAVGEKREMRRDRRQREYAATRRQDKRHGKTLRRGGRQEAI